MGASHRARQGALGLLALGPKFGGMCSAARIWTSCGWSPARSPLDREYPPGGTAAASPCSRPGVSGGRTHRGIGRGEERVEAILLSVGEGVVVIDLDGRIANVNAAYEDQSGYFEDELVGQELWKFYRGDEVRQSLRPRRTATAPAYWKRRAGWTAKIWQRIRRPANICTA